MQTTLVAAGVTVDMAVRIGVFVFEFSDIQGFDGAFYPIPGGLKECLRMYCPELSVSTSEGVNKVYDEDQPEYRCS